MPEKVKKGCLIVTGVPVLVSHLMWVLGTKLEYFARPASGLNC